MAEYLVKERIFMLDCARKYFSPEWIKRLIDELYDVGYNAIMLHFSEDIGLRLESKRYPWLAGGDHTLCVFGVEKGIADEDDKYLTQDEMADIVRYARSRSMQVIPSLDSPGHMNYAVKKYNEHFGTDIGNYYHKGDKTALVTGSSANKEKEQLSYSRGIDISNPEAVEFAKNLYTEYGIFFRELGCDTVDIGGDELLGFGETIDDSLSKWQNLEHWERHAQRITGNPDAVAYDAFILYINDMAELMRSIGYKRVRMWCDDAYRSFDTGWRGACALDKDIEIEYWTCAANNGENTVDFYLKKGHRVYNFIRHYAYYVMGFKNKDGTTPEDILCEWCPTVFDHEHPENNPKSASDISGCGFCLWSDIPSAESEAALLESVRPYFTAFAKKCRAQGEG